MAPRLHFKRLRALKLKHKAHKRLCALLQLRPSALTHAKRLSALRPCFSFSIRASLRSDARIEKLSLAHPRSRFSAWDPSQTKPREAPAPTSTATAWRSSFLIRTTTNPNLLSFDIMLNRDRDRERRGLPPFVGSSRQRHS